MKIILSVSKKDIVSGKMITLKSYPGEIAKIDGSDLYIKGWGNALVTMPLP